MQNTQDKVFNVLHVITKLPVGGVENMLSKIVKGYDKERFRASVCCIKEGGAIADELRSTGYSLEILNRMKGHGFDWRAVIALSTLIKREHIHILRTHQFHANLYGRIAGILAGVPVMVPSFHNLYVSPHQPKLHRRILNYFLSFFSDALIAVSQSVASDIARFDRVNPKKIRVIHNGIVREAFEIGHSSQEARRMFGLPNHSMIIGAVGRMTEQKGHRYLIEAASTFKECMVVIAGDGQQIQELKDLAARCKTTCIFLGRLEPPQIPLFLKALDIFCFPSLWEGFPSALAEAMAAGLPIVASDIPPHREVMGDSGILVPARNIGKFSEALRALVENPSLRSRLSEKASERSRLFPIENTVKAHEDLFEELLRKKEFL